MPRYLLWVMELNDHGLFQSRGGGCDSDDLHVVRVSAPWDGRYLSSHWKNGTFLLLAATYILDFIIRQVKHRGMSCLRVQTAA